MSSNNELRLLIKNELEYLKFKTPKSAYVYNIIYKKYKKVIENIIKHLTLDATSSEKMFCYLNNITEYPKCQHCNINPVYFSNFKIGYGRFCCISCAGHSNEVQKKKVITSIKNWGVEYYFQTELIREQTRDSSMKIFGAEHHNQSPIVQDKREKTSFKKYGVKNVSQSSIIQKRIVNTFIKNFGVEHPMQSLEVKKKRDQTVFKKYGVKNVSQSSVVKQKKIETNLKNLGVPNPSQSREIHDKKVKNSKKFKNYTFPSGRIEKIQGYENHAIDILLETYSEDDIIIKIKDQPKIEYWFAGKVRRHFLDIYIKSENKIIEVKSIFTYKLEEGKCLAKQHACIEYNYLYEIWIMNDKGIILNII